MIAVLVTALFFLVKHAVENGIQNGIKGSNNTIQKEISQIKSDIKNEEITLLRPTLIMGWYNSEFETAGYYKDYNGTVHLQGIVENGFTMADTVLFMLPKDYRPVTDRTFGITTVNSSGRAEQGLLTIEANGNVKLISASDKIILNGIYFSTKQNLNSN